MEPASPQRGSPSPQTRALRCVGCCPYGWLCSPQSGRSENKECLLGATWEASSSWPSLEMFARFLQETDNSQGSARLAQRSGREEPRRPPPCSPAGHVLSLSHLWPLTKGLDSYLVASPHSLCNFASLDISLTFSKVILINSASQGCCEDPQRIIGKTLTDFTILHLIHA